MSKTKLKNQLCYDCKNGDDIDAEEALYQHTYLDFVQSDMYFGDGVTEDDDLEIVYNGTIFAVSIYLAGAQGIINAFDVAGKLGIIKKSEYDRITKKSKDIPWLHSRYYDRLNDWNKEGARIEMNLNYPEQFNYPMSSDDDE